MAEEDLSLKPKNKNLLTYGAIAAGGVVILLVLSKRGGGSVGADASGGGVNTQQPIIIPAGGGSSGPDATTTAALTQLGANQQDLASGISAGFENIGNLIFSRTAAPESIPGPLTIPNPPAPEAAVHTIFGASVDISNAMSRFAGATNVKYQDTSSWSEAQTRAALSAAGPNAMIVGGYGAVGGVSQAAGQGLGITRVAGADRYETLAELQKVTF